LAPGINVDIDMDSFEEVDKQQSYWKLFPYMAKDFVTIADFMTVMASLWAPSGGGKVTFVPTSAAAGSLTSAYTAAAKTGGAVREEVIAGLEKITSGE